MVQAEEAVRSNDIADHLYRALVLPLTEFVGRIGWALVLILALVFYFVISAF